MDREDTYVVKTRWGTFRLDARAYRDYLQIFLFCMDGTVKSLRVMDLIQINMQGLHDASFLIRDHYLGFDMDVTVRGREYHYAHTY